MSRLLVKAVQDPDEPKSLMLLYRLQKRADAMQEAADAKDLARQGRLFVELVDLLLPRLATDDGTDPAPLIEEVSVSEFLQLVGLVRGVAAVPPANGTPSSVPSRARGRGRGGSNRS